MYEYSVTDPQKALLEVMDYDESLQRYGLAMIAKYAVTHTFKELTELSKLEKEVLKDSRKKAKEWGLYISKFWLTDVVEHKVYRIMGEAQTTVPVEEEE